MSKLTLSRPDDLYRLHRLLDGRRSAISRQTLIDELEISRSKLTRLITDLRNQLGAPLIFDAAHSGYRYDTADGHHPLPGLLDHALARIRILAMAARAKDMRHFQIVAGAILQRKRLTIQYYNRGRSQTSECEISPQRLTHYCDNWYLDAWCHQKKGIFAVECIRQATALDKSAKTLSDATLNRQLASAHPKTPLI